MRQKIKNDPIEGSQDYSKNETNPAISSDLDKLSQSFLDSAPEEKSQDSRELEPEKAAEEARDTPVKCCKDTGVTYTDKYADKSTKQIEKAMDYPPVKCCKDTGVTYTDKSDSNRLIRIAAIIAIVGNIILAALKITFGFIAGSSALVADGADSAVDVVISTVTLLIVAIMSKPADKKHPWGHRRAETIATAFLSFVIFFMGAQLIFQAVTALISGENSAKPDSVALIITGVSIVGKLFLALSQFVIAKRAGSAIIRANAKNMACDVVVSAGVLVGLLICILTGSALADKIITVLIGLWIIRAAISIFLESNDELMDGTSNTKVYRIIVEAVDSVEGASMPHRARMRSVAGFWDISFDIMVSPELSVHEAHGIATRVEDEIKRRLDNVFDIMVHIEPSDDDSDEAYGLSEQDMRHH